MGPEADEMQVTLPAGYLGSSLIGACLVACVSRVVSAMAVLLIQLTGAGLRYERFQSRRLHTGLLYVAHPVLGEKVMGRLLHLCARGWHPTGMCDFYRSLPRVP